MNYFIKHDDQRLTTPIAQLVEHLFKSGPHHTKGVNSGTSSILAEAHIKRHDLR